MTDGTPLQETRELPIRVRAELEDFQQRVLQLYPDDVRQIILFGSYARGEARPDSDLDVIVVVSSSDSKGADSSSRQWIADPHEAEIEEAAVSSVVAHGLQISPFVFSEKQFNANTPIADDARSEGIVLWQKEGWTMSSEVEVSPADPYDPHLWIELADSQIDKAQKNFQMDIYSAAISLAYYAMFYACRAALLTKGLYLKKHSAAVDKFRELLVHTGEIEEHYLTSLGRSQTAREKSDYKPYIPVTREEAAEVLKDAEAFLARIKELLGESRE